MFSTYTSARPGLFKDEAILVIKATCEARKTFLHKMETLTSTSQSSG